MIAIGQTDLACTTWGSELNEELAINCAILLPLRWDIIFVIDRFHRTDWLTGTTIHALIGLDIEHAIAFIDAIHWALFDAGLIFHIDTWLGNYIGHAGLLR
jgi:uncharacterized membrane protein YGL010W